ncbi:Nif3-like dinuclear metal center hexameric protein [Ureaplasma ceti]|uniref:GTP cyclohydrolase 1 type 2 homolog n=1 Tax=Ureaplasma ceti TaxID=3119530 RepID=A0ABP9U722_9BACT
MKKIELVNYLNHLYPFEHAEAWDQCSYDLDQNIDGEITNVLVALDLNKLSLKMALENNCNVIVTHHPLFKNNVENPDDYVMNVVNVELFNALQENQILHIALHTCFDMDLQGTSYQIFKKYLSPIAKLDEEITKTSQFLVYGTLNEPMKLEQFIDYLVEHKCFNSRRYLQVQNKQAVSTFAIGAGSCSSMMNEVLSHKTQMFLTGDVKWHGFQDGLNANLCMVDIGHDAEQVFVDVIYNKLREWNTELPIYKVFNLGYIKER